MGGSRPDATRWRLSGGGSEATSSGVLSRFFGHPRAAGVQWRPQKLGEGRVGKYDGKASYLEWVLVEWGAQQGRMEWPARNGENQSKLDSRTETARQSSKRVCFEDNRHVFRDSINLLQKYVVERGPQVLLLLLAIYRAELASIDFLANISSN